MVHGDDHQALAAQHALQVMTCHLADLAFVNMKMGMLDDEDMFKEFDIDADDLEASQSEKQKPAALSTSHALSASSSPPQQQKGAINDETRISVCVS